MRSPPGVHAEGKHFGLSVLGKVQWMIGCLKTQLEPSFRAFVDFCGAFVHFGHKRSSPYNHSGFVPDLLASQVTRFCWAEMALNTPTMTFYTFTYGRAYPQPPANTFLGSFSDFERWFSTSGHISQKDLVHKGQKRESSYR